MSKILFTGGGSAGHVTLNLALIPIFLNEGWQVSYVGSYTGIEKDLLEKFSEVKYHSIHTGKLRRYFSWQNFLDALKIPIGILQAVGIVLKEKPDVIFSKGGFVSFPVVVAGFVCKVPVLMHESDVTPGLANKMSLRFVSKFFTTFEDTIKYVKNKEKVECIGPVMSNRFENANRERGFKFCRFDGNKPVLLFMGGSLGAKSLNETVRRHIPTLLKKYQIVHLCGRGQEDDSYTASGYRQFEYIDTELKDLMVISDVVISRAGSNAIFELLSLCKPMVLVPLPTGSSRGEQMLNAKSFQAKGYAEIIPDEKLSDARLFLDTIDQVYANRERYVETMKMSGFRAINNADLAEKISQFAVKK